MAPSSDVLPPRRILLVSTVGLVNSAPILEIGKILHARGHHIEYATIEGVQEQLSKYPFISAVHILGRGLTPAEDEELYTRASRWSSNTAAGKSNIFWIKTFLDSSWTENYRGLKKLISEVHYDFIFSNYLNEETQDVMIEHKIPLAQLWPQAPLLLAPHPWIPGEPVLQQRCLTSEHASIYDRLFEMTVILRGLPWYLAAYLWTANMRWKAGVRRMVRIQTKPDYLVFINSFVGLEVPKDLPPLMTCIGPVLSDEFPPLDAQSQTFLESHPRTALIALGTHVRLSQSQFERLLAGFSAAIASNHIDGVLWALKPASRKPIDTSKPATSTNPKLNGLTYGDLLNNSYPDMLFVDFAPQRAVLSHPHTRLFLTHCGAASANEGAFHGVPMLTLAIYGDQIPGAMRLRAAGVAMSLDKFTFTPEEVEGKVGAIVGDREGSFRRNSLRLMRIARVANRGKERAADLIEEHMYDHELRVDVDRETRMEKRGEVGEIRELRPMHLQTADVRMGKFKANNWDLTFLGLGVVGAVVVAWLGPRAVMDSLHIST